MQIKFDHGHSFPAPLRIGGGLFTLFGIIGVIELSVFALALLLVGLYILSSRTGMILDTENRRFMEYTELFMIKRGKWKELIGYPDLAVLRIQYGARTMTRGMQQIDNKEVYFEVFMLTANHRKRVLISKHPDIASAQEKAKELAGLLGLNYVKFQPK